MRETAQRDSNLLYSLKMVAQLKNVRDGMHIPSRSSESLLLQRLLVRRFGALPNEVVNQIATAAPGQIETWGDRVLDAATLDDVFCP